MDGRFPFNNGGRAPPQLTAAQMRAVLGLSNGQQGLNEAYYLQAAQEQQQRQLQQQRQHQLLLQQRQQQQQQQQLLQQQQQQLRQQEIQRDLQLRQLLLQEQLSQRQELQFRAIGDQLNDFPDLQQHYQSLLLDERLQRQRQNVNSVGVGSLIGASNDIASVQQQQQQAALLREREQRLRAYKEQLLLQQQQQQLQQQLSSTARLDNVVQATIGTRPSISALTQLPPTIDQLEMIHLSNNSISQNDAGTIDLSGSSKRSQGAGSINQQTASSFVVSQKGQTEEDHSSEATSTIDGDLPVSKSRKRLNSGHTFERKPQKVKKIKKKRNKKTIGSKEISSHDDLRSASPSLSDSNDYQAAENVMDTLAYAVDLVYDDFVGSKGTFEDILDAAEENEHMEYAAMILVDEIAEVQPWSDSEDEMEETIEHEDDDVMSGLKIPTDPAEQVSLNKFQSAIPNLPEEPLLEEDDAFHERDRNSGAKNEEDEDVIETETFLPKQPVKPKKSIVNEYPYPIDTWWPSVSGIRRERKSCGETTDEDAFDDEQSLSNEKGIFRANIKKIKNRLSRMVQPGVLEKLPHCKIHRIKSKRKKNSTSLELVYCWQVTELYPNDPLVSCSVCGTWRHMCCGGHYKSYSVREHTKTPFVPVCENCHEEEKYLKEYPRGAKRIERQRAEQLRRGLATTSVMRYASYSKHGGTYKWPLGSVPPKHIGGHIRSVQLRHDKGEKQWNDMSSRLYRGHGYRAKERVRSRTKELERLLIAVEDAEGNTDRHNMIVFLQRDTSKEKPAGFEEEMRNIFDPADDEDYDINEETNEIDNDQWQQDDRAIKSTYDDEIDMHSTTSTTSPTSIPAMNKLCNRTNCNRPRRFDSSFCSDACGVSTMEVSLLHALQDANDLHPSVLRHS